MKKLIKKLLVFLFIITTSLAISQDKNLDIKIKYKLTRSESFVVEDVPGHVLTSAEGIGIAEINSESVKLKSTFNSDYTKGTGDFLVYYVLIAEDNSILTLKGIGKTNMTGTLYNFDGTVTVENASGKFESFKGNGTLKGSRKSVIEKGSEVEISILVKLD